MSDQSTVLSLHYLPCVEWMRVFLTATHPVIDVHEHFLKQTYRNRCTILAANGPLNLSIPVSKQQPKTAVKDMLIDNAVKWQHQHWESIRSAYNSSPFFEHYEPHFEPFYQRKYESLFLFNRDLLVLLLRLLKAEQEIMISSSYTEPGSVADYRERIHPKKKSMETFRAYPQVFSEKFSFVPNLTVLDVLFSNGPLAKSYL